MSDFHTEMADACGTAWSLLHAAETLVDKAMGREGGKDYCAIMTLLDAAKAEVNKVQGITDAISVYPRPALAPQRGKLHSLPSEAAAMGETFQPHQNGEEA